MRESLSYRSPRPSDVEKLATLGRETFIETFGHLYQPRDLETFLASKYTPAIIAREIADPALRYRVVEHGKDLLAFIKVGPLDLPVSSPLPEASQIKQLYVRQAFAGLGIGKTLMTSALAEMEAAGIAHCYLSVFSENHRAIEFYRRCGFRKCGEYHFPVGKHLDLEWIMVRRPPSFSKFRV